MSLNEESFSVEELRLAELFDAADRLSENAHALDTFLETLGEDDRTEVTSALACANALRMAGSEEPPPLKGVAWERILAALYPEPKSENEIWGFFDDSPESVEEAGRNKEH